MKRILVIFMMLWGTLLCGEAFAQLYISNSVWTEDMTNDKVWKPIESIV